MLRELSGFFPTECRSFEFQVTPRKYYHMVSHSKRVEVSGLWPSSVHCAQYTLHEESCSREGRLLTPLASMIIM